MLRFLRTSSWLGASLHGFLAEAHFAVEHLDGMLTIPAKCVAEFVDHRTFPGTVSTAVTYTAALDYFFFALLAHYPR